MGHNDFAGVQGYISVLSVVAAVVCVKAVVLLQCVQSVVQGYSRDTLLDDFIFRQT